MTICTQRARDTLDVVEPVATWRLSTQFECHWLGAHVYTHRPHCGRVARREPNERVLRNQRRQNEPVVVIGVFADEVYPSVGLRESSGGAAEQSVEIVHW